MDGVGPTDHPGEFRNASQKPAEGISAGQRPVADRLRLLADLIASSPHNLVAAGERAQVLGRHIDECDALAARLQPAGRWVDLGTGGGLPGLVLALRHPDVEWTLIDATAKKVAAVQEFAIALGLDNVTAVHGRAETLAHSPAHRGAYAGLVARAVATMAVLAELGRGFVQDTGRIVAVKGPAAVDEVNSAANALRTLRLTVERIEQLPGGVRDTWIVQLLAQGPPPTGYPRRDGVPKSDPLR